MEISTLSMNPRSFSGTIKNLGKDSVDIENASEKLPYENSSLTHYESSDFGIVLFDNILMSKYREKIKATATIRKLDVSETHKYEFRPELLSTDVFNTPNLWYVILNINDCEDISDFSGFSEVLLPSLETIENCLRDEEFIKVKNES